MTRDHHTQARETALKIVGLSDRGEITLTAVEKILSDFVARGRAAQKAVDQVIEAEKAKHGDA